MLTRDRLADLVIAALVGWWAPLLGLLGLLALYAIGSYLGWWVVGLIVVTAIGAGAWDAARWVTSRRPW